MTVAFAAGYGDRRVNQAVRVGVGGLGVVRGGSGVRALMWWVVAVERRALAWRVGRACAGAGGRAEQ